VQRVWAVLLVIELAFTIFAFIDALLAQEWRVKRLPKIVWLFIIVLISPLGGILWFAIGRERVEGEYSRRAAARPAKVTRPDDDPAFLKTINGESIDERIARLEKELAELDDDDPRGK
jgi:hypothetical protein